MHPHSSSHDITPPPFPVTKHLVSNQLQQLLRWFSNGNYDVSSYLALKKKRKLEKKMICGRGLGRDLGPFLLGNFVWKDCQTIREKGRKEGRKEKYYRTRHFSCVPHSSRICICIISNNSWHSVPGLWLTHAFKCIERKEESRQKKKKKKKIKRNLKERWINYVRLV